MSLNELNGKIEKSDIYIFMKRHERVIKIIEGIIIIGLLIGLNSYLFKDRQLKESIAENCGYTTNEYTCICDKNFVDKYSGIPDLSKLTNITSSSKDG